MKRIVLFLLLTFVVTGVIGCSSEPTRKIDTSKMSSEEKQQRKEKDGD